MPGCKNELADIMSRADFENKFQMQFEQTTVESLGKMDAQLDLYLNRVLSLSRRIEVVDADYQSS